MSNTSPLIWIIAGLLLLNVIGTIMILLRITEIDKETTTRIVSAPLGQTDSISRIETDPENSALPVQVSSDNAAVIIDSTAPEKLPADQASTEIIIAQVNGTDISQALLISYLNQIAPPEDLAQWNTLDDVPQNLLMQSINNAALDELLVQLAVDRKLDQNPVIQTDIMQNNRNILKTAYLNRLAPELVSNKDIAAQYETLVASLKGKLEYRTRHILLANQKEARIVDEALEQKKKSFDELAKLFSLDEATGFRGGDLGYVLKGELNPEFEKVVNDLEIGQRSRPFETELGWHIVVVDDRRDSRPMSFAQATPVIRQKLEQQAIQKYLEALLDSAIIDVLLAPAIATSDLSSNDKNPVE